MALLKLGLHLILKPMAKYNNVKVKDDGHTFDSQKEHRRYCELKLLQLGNEISGLELQPRYRIAIGEKVICTYVADFKYFDNRTGEHVTEDVKGVRTPVYKLKKKLMAAVHNIDVVEI